MCTYRLFTSVHLNIKQLLKQINTHICALHQSTCTSILYMHMKAMRLIDCRFKCLYCGAFLVNVLRKDVEGTLNSPCSKSPWFENDIVLKIPIAKLFLSVSQGCQVPTSLGGSVLSFQFVMIHIFILINTILLIGDRQYDNIV